MAENVATRALRGLGNALRLVGDRSAPPGIELATPSQPVDDLTAYVRYGSALTFGHLADGWVSVAFLQLAVGAGFDSVDRIWDTVVSGDFGISQSQLTSTMLWIYGVSLNASAVTQLATIGQARITIAIEKGIGDVATGGAQNLIFLNDGTGVDVGPLNRMMPNQALNTRFPTPWPPGSIMATRFNNLDANDVNWFVTFLCRLVPFGVPPLP